ncbi:glucosamine--fructose-6-phosphate aminotransferase [Steroidobacter denitrificans]|uniref:Glutamine--fructose-6-phosphate aminotransferase [isomerizing] n=1 Tax=Steroidobacter denitrificans TaxID=465721 RepID=A0A127FEX2_STEDE|nr:glutamine--fructose-6-phosphate transaminase (isomerizing) [Steroidobacter denitrificans]AMN48418.1 glucosamine--fructose-6-phosphate aminotransferase [Steroidobacter denitrificans]
MCGIVGAVADRNVIPILIEGLRRLEYRGYDSAGVAILNGSGQLSRQRTVGKVRVLQEAIEETPVAGHLGIAHTRWATHGAPSERNAHPHISRDGIAIVHNGIIENHEELREELAGLGYEFTSETDTEVIAHRIHHHKQKLGDLFRAVRATVAELEGAYALAVISEDEPDSIILARAGCPVVIGVGTDGNFVASDVAALLPVTRRFIFLEEGDVAEVRRQSIRILDHEGNTARRPVSESALSADAAEKGEYSHYMLKEIHEQPRAVAQTLDERAVGGKLLEAAFGPLATEVFRRTEAVQIIACGTSFHAGVVAKYFVEQIARLPCWVEIASEYRYRNPVVPRNTLFVTISQSGETADTLAALRMAKQAGYLSSLSICNVPESSLVRESDLVLLTRAGPEIGVASTKAFTTQLTALGMLVVALAKFHGTDAERERGLVQRLIEIPALIEKTLHLDGQIRELATRFADKRHALFLGRGQMHPIAMEGALKLKEISYIHAEAYPAGELKHGPLALVDAEMPVIVVAPNNDLLEKLKSNLQEVRARGGELYVFADPDAGISSSEGVTVITMPKHVSHFQAPAVYTIPLQLLAYHCAILKGTDVDQPRNLAKSVTVE